MGVQLLVDHSLPQFDLSINQSLAYSKTAPDEQTAEDTDSASLGFECSNLKGPVES